MQAKLKLAAAKTRLQQLQSPSAPRQLSNSGAIQVPSPLQQQHPKPKQPISRADIVPHQARHTVPQGPEQEANDMCLPKPSSLPVAGTSSVAISDTPSARSNSRQGRGMAHNRSAPCKDKAAFRAKYPARESTSRHCLPSHQQNSCAGQSLQGEPASARPLATDRSYHAGAEDDGLCNICMEAPVEITFQPCLHAVSCVRCAQKIMGRQNECPVCRAPLQAVVLLPPSASGLI